MDDKQKQKDKGVIMVLLERFNKQRYPMALELKKKVDSGELLNELDHVFLKDVHDDKSKVMMLIERNPEYKELAEKAMNLWIEIIEKDIANQKNKK
jgi:hypothetical protein